MVVRGDSDKRRISKPEGLPSNEGPTVPPDAPSSPAPLTDPQPARLMKASGVGMSVEREIWLKRLMTALRPKGIDPMEVQQVLMAAWEEDGFNPFELYLDAWHNRAEGLEKPPPITKVLSPEMMTLMAKIAETWGVGADEDDD